ncbi:hypothetical protein ACIO87_34725 [Streptomyces sp. NPDC087218]|uniref:hypothetical protein n=1 Tax=Streptomyces sp. NPDC087218 TaxID=3365769 RepID=UPI0038137B84
MAAKPRSVSIIQSKQTLSASRDALDGVTTTLDTAALAAAAAALHAASRVVVAAAGLPGAVALDAAYRLRALGCPVEAPTELAAEIGPLWHGRHRAVLAAGAPTSRRGRRPG